MTDATAPAAAPKTLYLVDGSTYIFRAFFAIRSLSNSQGLPTNAVYGFTAMLLKLVREARPDMLAVVFDKSAYSFRNDMYAEYKAHRPEAPPDLVPQFGLVREVTRAFRIPAIELEGWEADDILATLATQARQAGIHTTIVSSDKDLMQLVSGEVEMLDTMKDKRYGPAEVFEKMGVRPEQIVDLLALMGDSVDNIPGVPGIGAKTAASLLADYGTLEGIYANLDKLKGKRKETLENNREAAFLSQKLATVATEVPLDVTLDDLTCCEPDRAALTELFARLEFKTWHREFHDAEAGLPQTVALGKDGFALVTDDAALDALVQTLTEADQFALATQVTSTHPVSACLCGIAFAVDTRRAWYVPVGHQSLGQLAMSRVLAALRPLLEDAGKPKLAADLKAAVQILARHGVALRGVRFDPCLASYLLDADKYQHTLDNIALDHLNHKTTRLADVTGTGRDQIRFDQVVLEVARDYSCEDAQVTMALDACLTPRLAEANVDGLLADLELPLAYVLAEMERAGVRVDEERLRALSKELGGRADALEARCHALAGEPFSLGSPKQLGEILFGKLGLPATKRTKTGWSTNQQVLEELADEHELPALIVQWRQLTKLKSTYADVLPTLVHPETGRIHTSYNQAVAATGRLSSTDPNLQNIPIRTEEGRRIRECFIAAEGCRLVAADYSQIELRLMAHLCGDPRMQQAFREGADIHRRTASELFGVAEGEVTRGQRDMAKTINFGILYGMSAFRLAREQNLSRQEAKDVIERYYGRYPRIREWKEETLESARKTGQVSTMMGRIRRVADIHSKNAMARQAAERIAINTPIQGSAADIIKRAMIAIQGKLKDELPQVRMLLQVHDELVFEAPEALVDDAKALAKREMERVVQLDVPLDVNAADGRTWLEAH